MLPPRPPSPPLGPPRGTNFSRRKATQPLPPSPPAMRILDSSMNTMKNGRQLLGIGRIEVHDLSAGLIISGSVGLVWNHGRWFFAVEGCEGRKIIQAAGGRNQMPGREPEIGRA